MPDPRTIIPNPSPRLGFGLLLALLAVVAAGKVILADTLDPDCFWHLRVADEIARQSWPHPLIDDLSFASIRQPWTPYSWLAELGMKWLWDAGGFRAAVAVQAGMESAFILLLGLGALELSRRVHGQARYLASALAAAMGGILSLAYLSFRPVTAALTLLALVGWLLLRDRRMSQQSKAVWLVPPITAVLTNLHFFALFVPLWTAALLIGDLLPPPLVLRGRAGVGVGDTLDPYDANNPVPYTQNPHLVPPPAYRGRRENFLPKSLAAPSPRLLRGAVLLLLSLAACCLNPLLRGTLRSVLDYSTQDVMVRSGTIAEFRPFYSGIMGNVSAAFVAALWMFVVWRRIRQPRIPLGEVLWLAGSTALLFLMGRLSPVFAIIAAAAFAAAIPRLSDKILARPPIVAALAVVLALSAWPVARAFPRPGQSLSLWLNRHGPDAPNYPCLAADFVDRNIPSQTHHLICEWPWGGFLEWRLGDRFQTLMDGRTQLFAPEFWSVAALGSPDQRKELLAATRADAAVVRAGHGAFGQILTELNWKTVYRDDFAEVLVPPATEFEIRNSSQSISNSQ
ncbi:MAG: hypothetical protein ABSB42_20860 [Tepidisphaeraceae bacterium]|jgi:hypothetical protein